MIAGDMQRGVTLIELLVALAVFAILVTIGVPSFQNMMRSNQIAAHSNDLIALMTVARSEAIRRGQDVELVLSPKSGARWEAQVQTRDDDDNIEVLRHIAHRNTVLSEALTLRFNHRGYLKPFKNVTFSLEHVHCSSGQHRRVYTLDRTGRNEFDRSLPGCSETD